MPLEVVVSVIQGRGPGLKTDQARVLASVLKAKLSPALTVEDACHTEIFYNVESAPPLSQIRADHRLLYAAGLDFSPGDENTPDAVILRDPVAFRRKFPELALAIPVLRASAGVQIYTNGLPRVTKRASLTAVK